jgi:hypothetical protein
MIQEIEQAIQEEEFSLTKTEAKFIGDMKKWINEGKELTDDQESWLTDIWKRARNYS